MESVECVRRMIEYVGKTANLGCSSCNLSALEGMPTFSSVYVDEVQFINCATDADRKEQCVSFQPCHLRGRILETDSGT